MADIFCVWFEERRGVGGGVEIQVIFDSAQELMKGIFIIISHEMAQNPYFIKDFSHRY